MMQFPSDSLKKCYILYENFVYLELFFFLLILAFFVMYFR